MPQRIRWFELAELAQEHIRLMTETMRTKEFSSKGTEGFTLDFVARHFLEGKYIEKREVKEKVIDPFGNVLEFERVEFSTAHFRIESSFPQLQLTNSSTDATRSFINQIGLFRGFRFSVEEPSVDPLKWLRHFSKRIDGAEVTSLTVGDIPVSNAVAGKLVLTGTEDVRGYLPSILGKRKYSVEKAQINARQAGEGFKIELSRESKANIYSSNEKIKHLLRQSLAEAEV